MGYRSDVRCVFHDTNRVLDGEGVKKWLAANFPDVFRHWPEEQWIIEEHNEEVVVFEITHVKWYKTEYKEVIAFEEMLSDDKFKSFATKTSGNPNIAWEFGRIGECSDDAEIRASRNLVGTTYMFIHREFGWYC